MWSLLPMVFAAGALISLVTSAPPVPDPCELPANLSFDSHDAHYNELILPPVDGSPEIHAAWLKQITNWRDNCRKAINYTGAIYEVAGLKWTQTSYIQPQMHPFDRYFYNRDNHSYTVTRYLDDLVSAQLPSMRSTVPTLAMCTPCILSQCMVAVVGAKVWRD